MLNFLCLSHLGISLPLLKLVICFPLGNCWKQWNLIFFLHSLIDDKFHLIVFDTFALLIVNRINTQAHERFHIAKLCRFTIQNNFCNHVFGSHLCSACLIIFWSKYQALWLQTEECIYFVLKCTWINDRCEEWKTNVRAGSINFSIANWSVMLHTIELLQY